MAGESLTLCHSVSRVSVSEWSHSLSVACDLVHNDQRVVHILSRQSEGRAPVESQLMSCVSYNLQLSRSQGKTWAGEYPIVRRHYHCNVISPGEFATINTKLTCLLSHMHVDKGSTLYMYMGGIADMGTLYIWQRWGSIATSHTGYPATCALISYCDTVYYDCPGFHTEPPPQNLISQC